MKEALLKASGIGLSGIKDIAGENFGELKMDSVWQMEFGEGYQGALVTAEQWKHLKYYRLKG